MKIINTIKHVITIIINQQFAKPIMKTMLCVPIIKQAKKTIYYNIILFLYNIQINAVQLENFKYPKRNLKQFKDECCCFSCERGLDELELFICKICYDHESVKDDEIVCEKCGTWIHKRRGNHVFSINKHCAMNVRNMVQDFDPKSRQVKYEKINLLLTVLQNMYNNQYICTFLVSMVNMYKN